MKPWALLALFLCGCQAAPQAEDWTKFYEHQPTSILVLPVLNETSAAEAPLVFSNTIARPLLERGYYVFPIQPTLAILEANGIYEGGQLETVEPQKFHEILGVDALLCVTLQGWDPEFVNLDYRLVDACTGEQLWMRSQLHTRSPWGIGTGEGGFSVKGFFTNLFAFKTPTKLACEANALALAALPPGPLSRDQAQAREQLLARPKP